MTERSGVQTAIGGLRVIKLVGVTLGGFAVFATAALAILWIVYFQPVSLRETLRIEAASLALTSWALQSGSKPDDWETRAYLPASTVQKLADSLVGIEYVSRQGQPNEQGRYEGSFIVRLDKLSIETKAGKMQPNLTVTVRYQADRVVHWWDGATVQLDLAAQFMPIVRNDPKTKAQFVSLQIVPTSIEPSLSWRILNPILAGKMVSEIVAASVFVGYGEQLALTAPTIRESLKLDVNVDTTSNAKFDKDRGSYDLRTKLDGPTIKRVIEANVPVFASSGLWLLWHPGRLLPPAPHVDESAEQLEKKVEALRREVAEKIRPFEKTGDVVELRLSNRPLLEIAEEIVTPPVASQLVMTISSANADGTIGDAFLLRRASGMKA